MRGARQAAGRPLSLRARASYTAAMLLKLIALAAAAIPLILFVRAILGRRPTRLGQAVREAKKQIDLAITLFLVAVGVVVAFALGRIVWAWWAAA